MATAKHLAQRDKISNSRLEPSCRVSPSYRVWREDSVVTVWGSSGRSNKDVCPNLCTGFGRASEASDSSIVPVKITATFKGTIPNKKVSAITVPTPTNGIVSSPTKGYVLHYVRWALTHLEMGSNSGACAVIFRAE